MIYIGLKFYNNAETSNFSHLKLKWFTINLGYDSLIN